MKMKVRDEIEVEKLAAEMHKFGVTTLNRWAIEGAVVLLKQRAELHRVYAALGLRDESIEMADVFLEIRDLKAEVKKLKSELEKLK